jgi:hypothetical protein
MQHDVWEWIARVPHINAMLKPRRCSLTNSEACNFCRYATWYYALWIATSLACGGVLKTVKMLRLIAKSLELLKCEA